MNKLNELYESVMEEGKTFKIVFDKEGETSTKNFKKAVEFIKKSEKINKVDWGITNIDSKRQTIELDSKEAKDRLEKELILALNVK